MPLDPSQSRRLRHLAGVAVIAIGAIGFVLAMFAFVPVTKPWHMGLLIAIITSGFYLLSNPDTHKPTPRVPANLSLLFGGVFATFGALGPLLLMVFGQPPVAPQAGIFAVLIVGGIACLWCAAFVLRAAWLLLAAAVFQTFVPEPYFVLLLRSGLLHVPQGLGLQPALGALAVQAALCIVTGYVLVIAFVRRVEGSSARARAELDLARAVHVSLVPPIILNDPALTVLGRSLPSTEVGGDLIDLIRHGDTIDIILADVSGHGVAAGIVMGMVKSAARTSLHRGADLPLLLDELNKVLTKLVRPGTFVTLAAVRWRTGSADVEYALAGHLPILLLTPDSGLLRSLPNEALPLGIDADQVYAHRRAPVAPGDVLLLFTDGLIEVQQPSGRLLGLEAFSQRFAQLAVAHAAPDQIAVGLFDIASKHGPRTDDQSLVIARFGPSHLTPARTPA